MTLAQLLTEEKEAMVEAWFDLVLSTYPPETAKLWKANRDQFTNPVGSTVLRALGGLVEELADWSDADRVCAHLEEIVKIRAVQDFTPGKAVSFVYLSKKALKRVLGSRAESMRAELETFESRVDNLALLAFDIYVKNREQLYRMRVDEYKRAHNMLFRRAGLMCEPETEFGDNPLGLAGGMSNDKAR
ncbi:RsbRD N-terminal domain-containing protein [Desulfohalovibrio reitneri]|uniref:RsbRD N-terminal domain-containing protein n=1 Tax=Desulfohalovibrio reitneri TaxID=1307759 RepID=UPI0009DD21C6|nr:RsbRD N-terminal domain-containing protein [Desulfohalovibrio reitneri]